MSGRGAAFRWAARGEPPAGRMRSGRRTWLSRAMAVVIWADSSPRLAVRVRATPECRFCSHSITVYDECLGGLVDRRSLDFARPLLPGLADPGRSVRV